MIKIMTFMIGALLLSNVCLADVVTDANAKQYLREAYQKHFGMNVPEPFYVRGPLFRNAHNSLESRNSYSVDTKDGWTAAIWDFENKRLLSIFLELDGTSHFHNETRMVIPRCAIKTAVFIHDNKKTDFVDQLDLWNEEIGRLNQDWANFLYKQGYSAPAAQLRVTNFIDAPESLPRIWNEQEAYGYLTAKGYAAAEFDVLVWVNLDPQNKKGAGGGGGEISVGHFMAASEEFYQYSATQIYYIAYATFAHELAHVFGWDHNTAETDFKSEYIIIDPGYFGWTDVDGDGIIEIVDPTPYGQTHLSKSTQPIECTDGGPNTVTDSKPTPSSSSVSASSEPSSQSPQSSQGASSSASFSSKAVSSNAVSSNAVGSSSKNTNSSAVSSTTSSQRSCELDNSCVSLGAFFGPWNNMFYLWVLALGLRAGLSHLNRLKAEHVSRK